MFVFIVCTLSPICYQMLCHRVSLTRPPSKSQISIKQLFKASFIQDLQRNVCAADGTQHCVTRLKILVSIWKAILLKTSNKNYMQQQERNILQDLQQNVYAAIGKQHCARPPTKTLCIHWKATLCKTSNKKAVQQLESNIVQDLE